MGPCGYFKNRVPEPTLGPKTPKNGPRRAKIGVNAPHVVQLTGFGPKKPNLNRSVPRCVPFTRNQPVAITGNIKFYTEKNSVLSVFWFWTIAMFDFQSLSSFPRKKVVPLLTSTNKVQNQTLHIAVLLLWKPAMSGDREEVFLRCKIPMYLTEWHLR